MNVEKSGLVRPRTFGVGDILAIAGVALSFLILLYMLIAQQGEIAALFRGGSVLLKMSHVVLLFGVVFVGVSVGLSFKADSWLYVSFAWCLLIAVLMVQLPTVQGPHYHSLIRNLVYQALMN